MSGPGVKVEGADTLRRTLRQAGHDLGDLRAAHASAAAIAARASSALAPVRSGALRATLRSSGTQREAIVRAGRASVPYPLPIHWGWRAHNIRANPFISRGAQDSEGRWIREYEHAVDKIIDEVKGK